MKIIKPVVFQESQLYSSTATETYSAYNAATTYVIGNRVLYNNRVYESLQNSNVGHTPTTNPTWWLNIAPDNKHAMFDGLVNTQTTATSSLTVVVRPGKIIDSLAFFNITGDSLSVSIKDAPGGTVIYTNTLSLDESIVFDWYSYFFAEFDSLTTAVMTSIPPYSTCEITVTITGAGTVGIGIMTYGTVIDLGGTQMGASIGIIDYSLKDTDAFGNTVFVERAFSKRLEPQVYVENTKLRYVNKVLEDIRAIPTVWIGTDEPGYDPTIVYGFFRDYSIDISYPSFSMLSLTIEGLI